MKTCPACQENVGLQVRVCPYCGHRFIAATRWVLLIVIVLVILAGVLLFVTRSHGQGLASQEPGAEGGGDRLLL